jgi:hypothetical protein
MDTSAKDPTLSASFAVYDRHTGKQVAGPFGTRSRANGKRDKLDNDYGAYRYTVRPVKKEIAKEVQQVTA